MVAGSYGTIVLLTHKNKGRDNVCEAKLLIQLWQHVMQLESHQGAARQFPIQHELSSGKLGMHKQVFFFLSSSHGQMQFLPHACATATRGIIEADKQAKDRRESAGEQARGVEEF